jgi:hypothetical protein
MLTSVPACGRESAAATTAAAAEAAALRNLSLSDAAKDAIHDIAGHLGLIRSKQNAYTSAKGPKHGKTHFGETTVYAEYFWGENCCHDAFRFEGLRGTMHN